MCLTAPETLTTTAGLEVYKDEEPNKMVFTCGGKLLVLDMTFVITAPILHTPSILQEDSTSWISLESLHLTHAPAPGDETAVPTAAAQEADEHLPALLSQTIRDFIQACVRHITAPDGRHITLLLQNYASHLETLVFLDELAAEGPPHGVRWLREVGNLADITQAIAADEAKMLSQYISRFSTLLRF